jgi:hypothetical protein
MKKTLFAVFIFFYTVSASLFAWEAEDLKTYPGGIEKGSLIFNAGAGLGNLYFPSVLAPPLLIEGEIAVPLGGLPFGMGGIITYSGDKYNNTDSENRSYTYYHHYLGFQFRILYHFNWFIPKLDTYAAVDTGWILHFTNSPDKTIGFLDINLNLGGRYFFIPNVAVFSEVSLPMTSFMWPGALGHMGWIKAGIAFKI